MADNIDDQMMRDLQRTMQDLAGSFGKFSHHFESTAKSFSEFTKEEEAKRKSEKTKRTQKTESKHNDPDGWRRRLDGSFKNLDFNLRLISGSGKNVASALDKVAGAFGASFLATGLFDYFKDLTKSFQQMSEVGQTFSGGVLDMAGKAAEAGVSLDEYVRMMTKNSKFAAQMSGPNGGFGLLSKEVRDQAMKFGEYGMTVSQVNDMVGEYGETVRMSGKAHEIQGDAVKKAAVSINAMGRNATELAMSFGKSRTEIMKQAEAIMRDPSFAMRQNINNRDGSDNASIAMRASMQGIAAHGETSNDMAGKLMGQAYSMGGGETAYLTEASKAFNDAGLVQIPGMIGEMLKEFESFNDDEHKNMKPEDILKIANERNDALFDALKNIDPDMKKLMILRANNGDTAAQAGLKLINEASQERKKVTIADLNRDKLTKQLLDAENAWGEATGKIRLLVYKVVGPALTAFGDALDGVMSQFDDLDTKAALDAMMSTFGEVAKTLGSWLFGVNMNQKGFAVSVKDIAITLEKWGAKLKVAMDQAGGLGNFITQNLGKIFAGVAKGVAAVVIAGFKEVFSTSLLDKNGGLDMGSLLSKAVMAYFGFKAGKAVLGLIPGALGLAGLVGTFAKNILKIIGGGIAGTLGKTAFGKMFGGILKLFSTNITTGVMNVKAGVVNIRGGRGLGGSGGGLGGEGERGRKGRVRQKYDVLKKSGARPPRARGKFGNALGAMMNIGEFFKDMFDRVRGAEPKAEEKAPKTPEEEARAKSTAEQTEAEKEKAARDKAAAEEETRKAAAEDKARASQETETAKPAAPEETRPKVEGEPARAPGPEGRGGGAASAASGAAAGGGWLKWMRNGTKGVAILGTALAALDVYDEVSDLVKDYKSGKIDEKTFGDELKKLAAREGVGLVGSILGSIGGTAFGAGIGGAIGTGIGAAGGAAAGGVGAVPGGIAGGEIGSAVGGTVGGLVGGVGGYMVGAKTGDALADYAIKAFRGGKKKADKDEPDWSQFGNDAANLKAIYDKLSPEQKEHYKWLLKNDPINGANELREDGAEMEKRAQISFLAGRMGIKDPDNASFKITNGQATEINGQAVPASLQEEYKQQKQSDEPSKAVVAPPEPKPASAGEFDFSKLGPDGGKLKDMYDLLDPAEKAHFNGLRGTGMGLNFALRYLKRVGQKKRDDAEVAALAGKMGLQVDGGYRATREGGEITAINGVQVPRELMTDDQSKNIAGAREASAMMAGAGAPDVQPDPNATARTLPWLDDPKEPDTGAKAVAKMALAPGSVAAPAAPDSQLRNLQKEVESREAQLKAQEDTTAATSDVNRRLIQEIRDLKRAIEDQTTVLAGQNAEQSELLKKSADKLSSINENSGG